MAFRLYDLPEIEPSRLVGFAGNRIDRLSEKRQDDLAFTALELPETRVMILGGNRILLDYTNDSAPRALFTLNEAQAFSPDLHEPVLLGLQDGAPMVALMAPLDPDALEQPFRAQDYRSIYMEGLVPADIVGALAQAAALTAWHSNHRFCGRCGTKSEMRAGGAKRICPNCGAEHFPRTDPVAIMLPIRGENAFWHEAPTSPPGPIHALQALSSTVRQSKPQCAVKVLKKWAWPLAALAIMRASHGHFLLADDRLSRRSSCR